MNETEELDLKTRRARLNLPEQMTFLQVAFNCLVHNEPLGELYFEDPEDLDLARRIVARPELWLTRSQQFDCDVKYFRQMVDEDPNDPDGQVWPVVMAHFIATQRTLLDQNALLRDALNATRQTDDQDNPCWCSSNYRKGFLPHQGHSSDCLRARAALAEPPPPGSASDDPDKKTGSER